MFSAPYIETLVIGNIPLRCAPLYADSNDYDNNDIYHHIQYVVMKNNRNCIIINNIIVTIIVSVSWELLLTFCLRTTENSSFIHLPILGTSMFTVPKSRNIILNAQYLSCVKKM